MLHKESRDGLETSLLAYDEYGTVFQTANRFSWKNERTVGHNIPYYKRMLRNHLSATTDMVGSKVTYSRVFGEIRNNRSEPGPFGYSDDYISRGIHLPGPGPSIGLIQGPDQSSADNIAKMKFIKKARAAQRSLMGGVVLAELRETIHLVKRPLDAMRTYIDQRVLELEKTRRRKFFPRRRTNAQGTLRRAVSDQWLETSFGIRPFISDVNDATTLLWKVATDALHTTKYVQGKGQASIEEDGGLQSSGFGSLYDGQGTLKLRGQYDVRYYGVVNVDVPQVNDPSSWQQQLGFTLSDFVPTLWEALPWSFLIDYFTNVGEFLEAFSFSRSNLRWINKGEKTQVSNYYVDLRPVQLPLQAGAVTITVSGSPGYVKWNRSSIHRAVHDGDLIPSLEFNLPGANSLKWLNIAALVASRRSLTPFRFKRSG
jgi:hypothetical protein